MYGDSLVYGGTTYGDDFSDLDPGILIFPDTQENYTLLESGQEVLVFFQPPTLDVQESEEGPEFLVFDSPAPALQTVASDPTLVLVQEPPEVSAQYERQGGDVLVITSAGGPKGDDGEPGLSAYQVAVNEGFTGTVSDWLASLQGEQGPTGPDGPQGPPSTVPGPPGDPGKSAYQVAVDNGFVGTEDEWVQSLIIPSAGAGLYYGQTIAFPAQASPRAVTYDTVLEVGAGFTADPLTGIITVSSDGWYSLAAHIRIAAAVQGTHSLYVQWTGNKSGIALRGSVYQSAIMQEIMCVGDVFLTGGDQLQVWYDSSATTQITGSVDGSYTYFRIVNMQTGPQGPAGGLGPKGDPGSNFVLLETNQTVSEWMTAHGYTDLPDGTLIFQKA